MQMTEDETARVRELNDMVDVMTRQVLELDRSVSGMRRTFYESVVLAALIGVLLGGMVMAFWPPAWVCR
jgi:hypothetical protein